MDEIERHLPDGQIIDYCYVGILLSPDDDKPREQFHGLSWRTEAVRLKQQNDELKNVVRGSLLRALYWFVVGVIVGVFLLPVLERLWR